MLKLWLKRSGYPNLIGTVHAKGEKENKTIQTINLFFNLVHHLLVSPIIIIE